MRRVPPRFIDCELRVPGQHLGTTTREAELATTVGHALLGETVFPEWKPKIHNGEKRRWHRGKWIIEARH